MYRYKFELLTSADGFQYPNHERYLNRHAGEGWRTVNIFKHRGDFIVLLEQRLGSTTDEMGYPQEKLKTDALP